MKTLTVITATLTLILAGTAHAEQGKFRKWLHDKTAPKTEQAQMAASEQQAMAQPLTAEQQACNKFYSDLNSGKLPINRANEKRDIECTKLRNEQRATASTARTLPAVEVKGEKAAGRIDGKRVVKEAGKGCAIGAVMGLLTGRLDLRTCAAGAIGAGMTSAMQQLAHAREVESAAKAAGAKATIKTSNTTDENGKAEEKLDSLVLDYDPEEMAARSPAVVALLDKIAALAKADKHGGLTFTFAGANPVCQHPIRELESRGALAGNTVVDRCGAGKYSITISPIPDVR